MEVWSPAASTNMFVININLFSVYKSCSVCFTNCLFL